MTRRYYSAKLPASEGIVTLDEAESHHAIKVMRIRVGEKITLFDGMGREAQASVESIGRRDVVCKSEAAIEISRENPIHLTLGVAMPKGDRAKELIERLTELGVNRLIPLHCKRTQWPVTDNAVEKWRRVVIDACKQSQRNHLMQICEPQSTQDWITATIHSSADVAAQRFIVHPDDCNDEPHKTPLLISCSHVQAMIGPEGGFDDDEVTLAVTQGWRRFSLGTRIYRIETAAILATIKLAGF
jgi:16S rRNA (uracil1498-N3)-methyltransferase